METETAGGGGGESFGGGGTDRRMKVLSTACVLCVFAAGHETLPSLTEKNEGGPFYREIAGWSPAFGGDENELLRQNAVHIVRDPRRTQLRGAANRRRSDEAEQLQYPASVQGALDHQRIEFQGQTPRHWHVAAALPRFYLPSSL